MSDDPSTRAVSVSELTGHIKAVMEATFPPLWVAGEATDVAKPRSGHVYFTLKDDDCQIRAVMWRNVAMRLPFDLENGQAVLCYGELEVYAPRGTYQLIVRKAQPQGVGSLQQRFEALRAKLNAEGLFAAERKRPLPSHPRRVGVVTSPSGAAVHDFLVASADRWVDAEIFVIPSLVQGPTAAQSIADAISLAEEIDPPLDVMVVGRGGGSLEDLWSFNEEPVVRAVAECQIPIVSAVGHEVDVTLCDLVADIRALTPTDAATKVFPDKQNVAVRIDQLRSRLNRAMEFAIDQRVRVLQSLQSRPIMRKPMEIVNLRSRYLDELDARAERAMSNQLEKSESEMKTVAASLHALSPLATLARGYSVTLDDAGRAVTRFDQVKTGQTIVTKLDQGELRSSVVETGSDRDG